VSRDIVADAGVRTFVVHARKAWLKGLSPKENREKPPLNRERVYRLKERRPDLEIIINGELDGIDVLRAQLERVDGVMFIPYVERGLERGVPLNAMTKHTLGIFHGLPGARLYRRHLSENATKPGAGVEVLRQALDLVREQLARRAAAE